MEKEIRNIWEKEKEDDIKSAKEREKWKAIEKIGKMK